MRVRMSSGVSAIPDTQCTITARGSGVVVGIGGVRGYIRSMEDFRDQALITGYGRFCGNCKNIRAVEKATIAATKPTPVLSNLICPRCSAKMILRNGRKGKFYGCSRFPYCRGTKNEPVSIANRI